MGAYDDLLVDIPKPKGTYDDLLAEANTPEPSLKDKIYKAANKLFQPSSVINDETVSGNTGFDNKGALARVLEDTAQPNNLKAGSKIVDGLSGIAEVGARKGYAGIGRIEAGAIKALADVLGSNTLSNVAKDQQTRANEVEQGAVLRGSPVKGFSGDSIVQDLPNAATNALGSVITTAPSLAAGALVPGAVLPAIFATTGVQEYGQGRDAGLNPAGAALRAIPNAAFEVLGEKMGGSESLSHALRNAVKGNGVADLGAAMASSAVKEIPSEEFTTTGQFLTDKLPGIGTNQDASLADYGQQVKDTALATLLQSGGMGAGGSVLNSIASKSPQVNQEINQPITAQPEQVAQPQADTNSIVDALAKATQQVAPDRVEISQGNESTANADDAMAEQLQQAYDAKTPSAEPVVSTNSYDDLLAEINPAEQGAEVQNNEGDLVDNSTPVISAPDNNVDENKPAEPKESDSWIIRNKETGEPVKETFQKSVADKVNTDKYEVVPALQHLQELNQEGSKARNYAQRDTSSASASIQVKKQSKPKAKVSTLLGTLKSLGGVTMGDKLDVTGEDKKFAPGGYNQVFTNKSRRSLKVHIESGSLDDYLPYNMRLESQTQDSEAYDSTEAYDYLADKIRNGERVLHYDVEQEIKQNKFYQEAGADAQSDIQAIDELFNEDEINEQLQIAGNDERNSTTEARQFKPESTPSDAGSGTGNETGTQAEQPTTEQKRQVENTNATDNSPTERTQQPKNNTDLLGENTSGKQAIADAERAKDAKRNSGSDNSSEFNLTGSNSEADQAAAAGAQDLFAQPNKSQDEVAKATKALDDAGVTGTEKLNTIAQVRQGNLTADEVASAHKSGGDALFSKSNQTSTPEFKSWFGNSKVVDANGDPLVVYHGTSADFNEFDYGKIGTQGRAEGAGFYFTNNQSVAKGYGSTMEVYLSIEKPLAYDAKPFSKPILKNIIKRVAEIESERDGMSIGDGFLSNFGDVNYEGLDSVLREATNLIADDETAVDQLSGIVGSGVNPEVVNQATKEVTGYDGIIAKGFGNQGDSSNTIYVSFFPNQIKSATKNNGEFDKGNNDIRFSNTSPTSGISVDEIKKAIANDIYNQEVDVYQSMADAPIYIQVQAKSEGANGIEGYFDGKTNRVALIANNIPDTKRALEIARHELIGHYGMENMLGKDLMGRLANRVLKAEKDGNKTILEVAKHVDETQPNIGDFRRAKEMIAVMAERNMQNDIVKRVMDAIRKFLKEIGFTKEDITDVKISILLREAQEYLKETGRSITEPSDALAYSKSNQTETPEFKKWFGDSKVVDEDGKPLIMYHGTTADFGTFKPNSRGAFFFARDFEEAERFADGAVEDSKGNTPLVMPVYLKANNIFDATNPEHRKIVGFNYVEGNSFGFDELERLSSKIKKAGFDAYYDTEYVSNLDFIDSSWPAIAVFSPNQIKSAIGNNGNFDESNPNINFSRKPITTDSRDNIIFRRDELGRIQLTATGKAYDVISEVTNNLANKINFGMASPELRKLIRHFKADMQKAMETAGEVAKNMSPMSIEDRSMVSDVVEKMVKTGVVPPDHIVKIATGMQSAMDTQTDELVKLGMLSKDSAERWRGKYLPRFYKRDGDPALTTWAQKLLRTAMPVRGMGGGSLKGRGLYQEVDVKELPQWESLGWEVRDNLWKKNRQGKLELIDPNKVRDTEQVMIWRDYTPTERESMNENRDALFRFVMGYTSMQNDIALGRMFDSISKNQEWTRSRPSEGYVKVPDSEIAETGGVKRYGNLAGLYVKEEILSHISQYEESSELWKYYKKALSFWKLGKTVLNPVSHMNNVVSNLTMAHFAGVSYWDTHKYVGALRDFVKGSDILEEAKDAGLMTGDITRAELISEMPDDIKELMNQQDSKIKKSVKMTYNILTFGLTKPMSKAYRFEDDFFKYLIYKDARNNGVSPDDAVDYATKYIFNYDDLPKAARTVRDVGIPFFAYTYKAIPALSHTAFNYPWRMAAPAAAIAGINALAYGLVAGDDDDDWKEKLAKGAELEAEERKNLPPWMQGKSALGTEKTIRLGTDDKTGLPVYMDVSRMIPGGDVFDLTNQADGLPLPAPIMPSNPVLTTIAAMLWNKDTFTGKDVTDQNDTSAEKSQKRSEWLLKQLSPAIAPTGYHFDRLMQAGAQMKGDTIDTPFKDYTGYGKDGLPVQPKYAIENTFGIKAKPTDLQLSADITRGQDFKEFSSIKAEYRQLARMLDKKAISQREFDRRSAELEAKAEAISNK